MLARDSQLEKSTELGLVLVSLHAYATTQTCARLELHAGWFVIGCPQSLQVGQ